MVDLLGLFSNHVLFLVNYNGTAGGFMLQKKLS